ncbi:hypothetical protein GOBAR_DD03502 [Gossypium barbadense]|nr:hypothetical protein GOBAR_DD03502 [Gossypium barbadense]
MDGYYFWGHLVQQKQKLSGRSRHIKKAKPTVEDKSYICGSIKEIKVRARRFQYSSFGFMPGTANSANHVLAEEGRRYVSFVYGIEEPVRVDEEACQD